MVLSAAFEVIDTLTGKVGTSVKFVTTAVVQEDPKLAVIEIFELVEIEEDGM